MNKIKIRKNNYISFIILVIILFIIVFMIVFSELDRRFDCNKDNQNNCLYNLYEYYIKYFPLLIVGFYNTLIRILNPSHIHKFNVNNFESHYIIQNRWKDIQKEAIQLYLNKNKLLNMKDIGVMNNFNSIDQEKGKWKVFVIKWYDKILDNSKFLCPITSSIINQCPDIHAAMFSILEPGKYIPPHKGPFTACLRYHIGLKIPKDYKNCYININNEKFYWKEGEALIFDDTYMHSVYNNTNEPRIILFIDIERPLSFPLNKINKILCKSVSIAKFNKGVNDISEKNINLYHS